MDEIEQRERESRADADTKYQQQRNAEEERREQLADESATADIWTYREQTWGATDLTGFSVEAVDGDVGKIDEATTEVAGSYIVVDTGPWIFGKKVMLPAGVVDRVDPEDETTYVSLTKDQIKNAPEFDETRFTDDAYRSELGGYYGRGA